MILAYRTIHNPDGDDQIIDIRWFKDQHALQSHRDLWRGETWIEVREGSRWADADSAQRVHVNTFNRYGDNE